MDGNIYAAPFYSYSYNTSTSLRSLINQDWLDTLDLKAPRNSEELITVLTAFRDNDPNGNGVADEIPMMGLGNASLNYLQTCLFIITATAISSRSPKRMACWMSAMTNRRIGIS